MKKFIKWVSLITIFSVGVVNAQWPNTVEENLIINNYANFPFSALEDGNGGFYFIYGKFSYQNDTIPTNHLWFQHVDKSGHQTLAPKKFADYHDYYDEAKMIRAGDGNILIGMLEKDFLYMDDTRHFFIRTVIQKVDTLGNRLWGNGTYIVQDTLQQLVFDFVASNDGGCYASTVSIDYASRPLPTGYKAIQKISSEGKRLWSDSGVVVYTGKLTNGFEGFSPKIFLSEFNSIIVTNLLNNDDKNNVLKLSENGEIEWELSPRNNYRFLDGIEDYTGGIYTFYSSWVQEYLGLKFSLEGIDKEGNYTFEYPVTFVDSSGVYSKITDVIMGDENVLNIFWRDSRANGDYQTFFQRVEQNGNLIFGQREVEPVPPNIYAYQLIPADSGFMILTGERAVLKLTIDGEQLWGERGVKFAEVQEGCFTFPKLIDNNSGGCIIVWQECRLGIRAKMINKLGELGEIVDDVETTNASVPQYFDVSQNYPNPFNSTTSIEYSVKKPSNVMIRIFNSIGELINSYEREITQPNNYLFEFNAAGLSSGNYFVEFNARDINSSISRSYKQIIKLTLLK